MEMQDEIQDKEQGAKHAEVVGTKLGIANAIQSCFNNPEISDVIIKIGTKTFHAHKFVISLLSDVFRAMCSQRWNDSGMHELELQECDECIPVFPLFLQFLYSGVSQINIDTTLPLLMLADKYNVQQLKQGCESYMKKKVSDGSIIGALRWLSYAQMSRNKTLQSACVDVVVMKMDDVVRSEEFLQLDIEFLELLLGRDDLVLQWEYTVYEAVRKWIQYQSTVDKDKIKTLLSYVRFPMMLPMQLLTIEKSEFFELYKTIFDPLFACAHRFRSIASEMFDESFEGSEYRPRNYTHSHWCHIVSADIDNDGFIQKSIGVRCLNHPVTYCASPEQCWQLKIQSSVDIAIKPGLAGKSRKNNAGVSPFAFYTSPDQVYQLDLCIIPMKQIPMCVAVDVSLFLVKRDRLVKHLQDITLYHSEDCTKKVSKPEDNPSKMNHRVFNPSPMHFSFIFNSTIVSRTNDAVIKHSFSANDLEHPAEVPCFKFAGPSRTMNSVRLAIVFKPRFDFANAESGEGTKETEKIEDFDMQEPNMFDLIQDTE